LYYLDPFGTIRPKQVVHEFYGDIIWLNWSSHTSLLACACAGDRKKQDGFVMLFDTKSMVTRATLTYPNVRVDNVYSTFQNVGVSMVKFADEGRRVFASAVGHKCDGVKLWDVEKLKEIGSFNHHPDGTCAEPALYEVRDPHEIHGVCPTPCGDLFVSSSYRFLYVWDVRAGSMIKQVQFYPPVKGPIPDTFFMNQESAYPLSHVGFTSPSYDQLTVIGQRKAKCITYHFPSMEPIENKTYDLPGEMSGMNITPYRMAGCDIYGGFYVWDTSCLKFLALQHHTYVGSGANGICFSEKYDTLCWSSYNPQSGWNGQIAGFASILPPTNQQKKLEKKQRQRKCTIQ